MWRLVAAVVVCVGLSGCVVYLNPLCTDAISNGTETDVDCGGGCNRCEIGDSCQVDADCEDSTCERGKCTALPCFNGETTEDETDIDCGGPACRTCSGGRHCEVGADCASGICQPEINTCAGLALSFTDATYPAGNKPYSLATVDIDGDGDIDLLSAEEINSQLWVLSNDGTGSFQNVAMLSTGTFPTGSGVGDFNGDGVPDVVTADYRGDSISVFANVGGTLSPRVAYPTVAGGETSNVALGDLNGDGNLDVAATNQSRASVSLFFGAVDGTFGPAVDIPVGLTGASHPYSAAIADFNGDGRNDLAIADTQSLTIIVRLGNGDGTLQPEVAYPTRGSGDLSVITDDVNGDGRPDLICANRQSNNVSVLLGRGDGTFRRPVLSTTRAETGPYTVATADFNNDGVLDLVTGNYKTEMPAAISNSSVLLGIGNGNFEAPRVLEGFPSYGVAVGDFNADGKPDFAAANFANQTVTIQINTSP
ncbi:MAG: VCBS repeat-containing protein [Myxococcales bacterium]|nr:VCBS repeat-containing protein [Myxococcales bacterium]